MGIKYPAESDGRLESLDKAKLGNVATGIKVLYPLVEARVSFEISKWELDNIVRGAKDPDLSPLEDACKELALFEENLVYNGYKKSKY